MAQEYKNLCRENLGSQILQPLEDHVIKWKLDGINKRENVQKQHITLSVL